MMIIALLAIVAILALVLVQDVGVPDKGNGLRFPLDLQLFAVAGKGASFKVGANAIGGLNEGTITINGETIDVTTFLSGGWIEKIQGLKSAEISLSGFWLPDDANGQTALRTSFLAGTPSTLSALLDGTNGWTGDFLMTSLEIGAAVDGEVSISMSFESTGAITVVAA